MGRLFRAWKYTVEGWLRVKSRQLTRAEPLGELRSSPTSMLATTNWAAEGHPYGAACTRSSKLVSQALLLVSVTLAHVPVVQLVAMVTSWPAATLWVRVVWPAQAMVTVLEPLPPL